jgi:hypothetical protein
VSSFARRTAAIAGACASAWIASAYDDARANDPLRVLLVGGDADAEIVTRVEGQVADLAAELERDRSLMPSSPLPVQLVTARRLARAHTADVVVWFVRADGDVIVHVTDARGSRVLVRRVESSDGAMAESAASEAAAVIVRTAIRGLAAGGEIGIEVKPEPPPPAPAPTPTPTPTPARDDDLGGVRPLRPSATIGWTSVYDGESSTGHHGVSARLGVAGGPWRFAVALTHRPSESLESQMATIDVERQTIGVALGLDVAGGAQLGRDVRWRVGADVLVAMTRFGRTTTSTGVLVEPTADRATWSPTATPSVRISRRIARGAWIELALGVDLVAEAPEFGVSTPTGFATIGSLWPVEPHAALGVVVDPF